MANGNSSRGSKIEVVGGKYGLPELGDELAETWSEPENGVSVRKLTDRFNVRILQSVLEASGEEPLEGDAENVYRLLTDDDVTSGTRVETETRLSQRGIDVNELRNDFVSHQTVYRYLTEQRDVTRPQNEKDSETVLQTINSLSGRTSAVVESNLRSLANAEKIALGEPSVIVNVSVFCEACGAQYEANELLERGGCDCQ